MIHFGALTWLGSASTTSRAHQVPSKANKSNRDLVQIEILDEVPAQSGGGSGI